MLKLDLQTFATQVDQKVHSGHTINIRIGTTTIGKAQGIDGDRSFGTEGVYEIGSIMPSEHINLRYEGSVNIERFFVRKESLKDLGYASLGEEVLKQGTINIEVIDKDSGSVVRVYYGCTIVNYRETFRANSIAGENATFTYLYCKNSADQS